MDPETGYTYYPEAPEMTAAEEHEMFLAHLEETAPPIAWDDFCYCDDDNQCIPCSQAAYRRHGFRRAA